MSKLSSVEMEQALLGYIIEDGSNPDLVVNYIFVEDFFNVKNQLIYKTILLLSQQNVKIEYLTLINELKKQSLLTKIGGQEYIVELMSKAGLKSNITKYAMEINNFAQLRKIKQTLSNVQNKIDFKNQNVKDVLSNLNQQIMSISHPFATKNFESSLTLINNSIKKLEEKAAGNFTSGIKTQYKILDSMTNGFQKGDLIILASRPSMGKTSFSLNLAINISRTKNVAFFSLEMQSEQLINRILSNRTGINSNLLRDSKKLTPKDWDNIYHYQKEIGNYNLFIDDTPGLKLSELIWKTKTLAKTKNKPDIIIIDYMQLIRVNSSRSMENRQAEVSIISNGLKQLARELEIPIISLAQLSRRVEQRESKIPIMSDLRESGSIEQDADIVMFLYRDSYYNDKEEEENIVSSSLEEADIIVAKHRNGETGKFKLIFNQSLGRFYSIPKINT